MVVPSDAPVAAVASDVAAAASDGSGAVVRNIRRGRTGASCQQASQQNKAFRTWLLLYLIFIPSYDKLVYYERKRRFYQAFS
jgi:hypothetical protein